MRCGPAESTHHWGNRTAKHCVATRRRVRTSISERLFPMCADRSSPAAAATSVSVARTEYKRPTVTQFGRSERKRNESQITSIRDAKYQIPVIPIFQCLLFVFGFSFQRRHPFFLLRSHSLRFTPFCPVSCFAFLLGGLIQLLWLPHVTFPPVSQKSGSSIPPCTVLINY